MVLQMRLVSDDPAATEAWLRGSAIGFLRPPDLSEEELELRRAKVDLRRARGIFEGDRCVANYRSFDQEVTAVGGALLPSNAVANVSVAATHRRRGLLTRLITADLTEARERGDVVSTLLAAEYRIYSRYGYGAATSFSRWRVDIPRTGLDPRWAAPEEGSLEFVDGAEARKVGPELHDRFRRLRPGVIDRNTLWWEQATGATRIPPNAPGTEEGFHVLYRDADGVPQGLAMFTSDGAWEHHQPAGTATVHDLVATGPAAERALWYFLCSIDWVTAVRSGRRAPDDLLPELLPNPRAAALTDQADFLWLRPLDVPRMLSARGYAAAGELVLDVRDPLGLAGGRYLLAASPEGASCTPTTTRSADLTLDTGMLGRLYLGDVSAARLAALGALDEETAGAIARADLLLHTGRRPWCPDMF
jgi:predicted acetyltransferase